MPKVCDTFGAAKKVSTQGGYGALCRSAYICFPVNRTEIYPEYMGNFDELQHIMLTVDSIFSDHDLRITRVTLLGLSSPEGSENYNNSLSVERMHSLKEYIRLRYDIPDSLIEADYAAENWPGLIDLLQSGITELPHNQEILDVAEAPFLSADEKERLLKTRYPEEWRTLLHEWFPTLRRTEYTIEFAYIPYFEEQARLAEQKQTQQPVDTVQVDATVIAPFPLRPDTLFAPAPPCDEIPEPILAIKNNLLYDFILAPNLEIERWFGKYRQFSIMAEWAAPWYVWHHNSRAYEVLNVGGELRWWVHRADPCHRWLTGFFLGLYGMGGKYDIEWNHKGYQGEHWSAGLTLGAAHRIARRWNLEYSLSAGYLSTDYRRYYGMFDDRHLIWQHNGHATYFGPTKLKLSLVYLLGPRQ